MNLHKKDLKVWAAVDRELESMTPTMLLPHMHKVTSILLAASRHAQQRIALRYLLNASKKEREWVASLGLEDSPNYSIWSMEE